MKFKDVQVTGTSSRTAKLEIDLQSPYIMRNSIIKREIPVSLSVNPTTGEITNCNALNSVDAATSIDGSCPAMTPDEIKSSQMMLDSGEEYTYSDCGMWGGAPGYYVVLRHSNYIAGGLLPTGQLCYISGGGSIINYTSSLPKGYPTQVAEVFFNCPSSNMDPPLREVFVYSSNLRNGRAYAKCEAGKWTRYILKDPRSACNATGGGGGDGM